MRKKEKLSYFDENLIDKRWTLTYYRNNHRLLKNWNKNQPEEVIIDKDHNIEVAIETLPRKKQRVLSYGEKRKKVSAIVIKF